MRAFFHDFAIIDDQYLVGVAYRAQAVGNYEAGPTFHQPQQRLLDAHLRAGIHTAGGLIENKDGGVGQDRARNRQQLALPLAEVAGSFGEDRLVAVRQLTNKMIGIGHFGGLNAFLIAGIQPPVANVIHYRA